MPYCKINELCKIGWNHSRADTKPSERRCSVVYYIFKKNLFLSFKSDICDHFGVLYHRIMVPLHRDYLVGRSAIHRQFLRHRSAILFGVRLHYGGATDCGLVGRRPHIVLFKWYLEPAGSRHALFMECLVLRNSSLSATKYVVFFVFVVYFLSLLLARRLSVFFGAKSVCQKLVANVGNSRVLLVSMGTHWFLSRFLLVKGMF